MVPLEDDAVVLRRIPYRESSLVVHLLTRHHGVIPAMAKGVRAQNKGTARAALAGWHTLRIQGRARDWGDMALLTGAETVKSRPQLLAAPLASAAGEVMREALQRHAAPGDPQPLLFLLLDETLDRLERGDPPLPTLARALTLLLHRLGYGWQWERCGGCGAPEPSAFLSLKHGQGLCRRCGEGRARRSPALSPTLALAMRRLAREEEITLSSVQEWMLLLRLAAASIGWRGGGQPLASAECFRRMLEPSHPSTPMTSRNLVR
ncbi:MAG: DNA repair protein RecO [Magnetococcales bacterium]|nr:DNA repair protein RecO [Magnetococcales bacterium]